MALVIFSHARFYFVADFIIRSLRILLFHLLYSIPFHFPPSRYYSILASVAAHTVPDTVAPTLILKHRHNYNILIENLRPSSNLHAPNIILIWVDSNFITRLFTFETSLYKSRGLEMFWKSQTQFYDCNIIWSYKFLYNTTTHIQRKNLIFTGVVYISLRYVLSMLSIWDYSVIWTYTYKAC